MSISTCGASLTRNPNDVTLMMSSKEKCFRQVYASCNALKKLPAAVPAVKAILYLPPAQIMYDNDPDVLVLVLGVVIRVRVNESIRKLGC